MRCFKGSRWICSIDFVCFWVHHAVLLQCDQPRLHYLGWKGRQIGPWYLLIVGVIELWVSWFYEIFQLVMRKP
jgi:hypothetical protein